MPFPKNAGSGQIRGYDGDQSEATSKRRLSRQLEQAALRYLISIKLVIISTASAKMSSGAFSTKDACRLFRSSIRA